MTPMTARCTVITGAIVYGAIGGFDVAALITWICRADHDAPDRTEYVPVITLHERKWAYCLRGGSGEHEWDPIESAPFEIVRYGRFAPGTPTIQETRTK